MKKLIFILCLTFLGNCLAMEKNIIASQQTNDIEQIFSYCYELPNEITYKILDMYTQTVASDTKNCREFKRTLCDLHVSNSQINNLLELLCTNNYIFALAAKLNNCGKTRSFYVLAQIILSKPRFEEFKKIYQEQANKLSNKIRDLLWKQDGWPNINIENDIKLLIVKGANLNLKNLSGDTLLIVATDRGLSNIVKMLIDAQVDLDIQNNFGANALILSLHQMFGEDLAKMIVEAGANVNLQNNEDDTALILAVRNGFTSMVKFLINAKANLNLQDKSGNTALIWASESIKNLLNT